MAEKKSKATRAETELRIQTVYGLLCNGKSRTQILQICTEKWPVGERMIELYMQRARILIERDCEIARPAFLAEVLANLRELRDKAEEKGNYQTSLNALRLMTELTGLTK